MPSKGIVGLCMFVALWAGCGDCENADPRELRVDVHVPYPGLEPMYCMSSHVASCRGADEVVGLVHTFRFAQRPQGRLWCSYEDLPGVVRTETCEEASISSDTDILVLRDCEAQEAEGEVGVACGVLTQRAGLPRDSCGEGLFCRSRDSTCQPLPETCESDADCTFVSVCDETRLCVRYVCDEGACVYPDECLDTSDCHRSHSRCSVNDVCDTFTCETGRCVGATPATRAP